MILSPNSLTQSQLCMKRFEYYKIQNLVLNKTAKALNEGTLIHQILADYYKGIMEHADKTNLLQAILTKARVDSIEMQMEVEDVDACIKTCIDYFNYYQNDTWQPIAVEQMFSTSIFEDDELNLIIEGRIDLIVSAGEEKIIVDHKKEGRKSKRSILDNQFICYPFVFGLNKTCQNVLGMQKSYPPEKRFERILHSYSKEHFQEWYESTIYQAKSILRSSESGFFPRSYSSCNKWGGCPYKQICESTPDTRAWVIERDYMRSEFDLQKEAVISEDDN